VSQQLDTTPPVPSAIRAGAGAAARLYLVVAAAMMVVAWQSLAWTGRVVSYHVEFPGDGVLGGLAHYDGGWYEIIASTGYRSHQAGTYSPVAFFPSYPLAMRYLGAIVGDTVIAGILLTLASGVGTAALFWTWCRERIGEVAASTALLVLLLYPYGFFLYGVVYAEALFLLVTLAAFWAVEHDRPLLAGLAGAVATATRPVGIAVVIGLVVRTLERRSVPASGDDRGLDVTSRLRLARDSVQRRDSLVLLSLGGLAAYCGFLWHRFGNPFLFAEVQEYWGQEPGLRTWLKIAFVEQLHSRPSDPYTWALCAQAVVGLAAAVAVPLVGRRFGWGYAAYVLVAVMIPLLGTRDFTSVGRYTMAAFPVFALAGEWLAKRPPLQRSAVLAASGCCLALAIGAFAHGVFVS
jgi:hypothetical protein